MRKEVDMYLHEMEQQCPPTSLRFYEHEVNSDNTCVWCVDFDLWIEDYCLDADIFVLVVNSESTLMMREKSFFKKVAERVAKPNVLVLLNRWDLASEEEEYLIHAAQVWQ